MKGQTVEFTTPFEERSDLYEDCSESHAARHPEILDAQDKRHIEVARIVDVAFDPVTRKKTPQQALPHNVLKSRKGHAAYVEAFTFKPTAPEFLAQMDFFLKTLISLMGRCGITTEHYIIQQRDALHFSFESVTTPNIQEKFFAQKQLEADRRSASSRVNEWKELIHLCQVFLDTVQPGMVFKEIKMNDDGHVVLRMTIQQADAYLTFRNRWQRLFSDNYQRYTEQDKITTLACVLGVVDVFSLSKPQRIAAIKELNDLFKSITNNMTGTSCSFSQIELSHASNRMLQKQDLLGLLTVRKGYVHLSERFILDKTPVNPATLHAYIKKNMFQFKTKDKPLADDHNNNQKHPCSSYIPP
ncbi:MAG: hypothetical protein CK424_07025 [Legionella sp.]|nr:MAG: hypothetical protein CK424_07025 [Legionella sp.]